MMKIFFKLFHGYKNFIATIAQIILAILILPGLSFILQLIAPDSSSNFVMGLIQAVPIFDVWTDIIKNIVNSFETPDMILFLNMVMESLNSIIFEAEIMGMCIYFCKTIGIKLKIRGVPVIQTVLGVFAACVLIRFTGNNDTNMIIAFFIMLLINILLTLFVADSKTAWKKFIAIFIGLGMSAIIAALATSYIVVNVMIINGWITNLSYAVRLLTVTIVPLIVFLLIDYYFLTPLTND